MKKRCSECGRTLQRSTAQNARYWSLLTLISERLKVDGHSFDPDIWHESMKRRFLGAKEYRLPGGDVLIVPNSSAELDEDVFSDYLGRVEEWARDRNVWLPERDEA